MSLMRKMYGWVDPQLNYGREQVADFVARCAPARSILDIAAGYGTDLLRARDIHNGAVCRAFDVHEPALDRLRAAGVEAFKLDIERDVFPLPAASVDIVIANQVVEHTKDIFWIFHQICTVLAPGGHVVLGVPNLASLHNRLLLAFGSQPTSIRSASAHVRGFTRDDLLDFVRECSPGTLTPVAYAGSNFYPFPAAMAKPLARWLPGLAWANFMLFRKDGDYDGAFVRYPADNHLETNYFTGTSNR